MPSLQKDHPKAAPLHQELLIIYHNTPSPKSSLLTCFLVYKVSKLKLYKHKAWSFQFFTVPQHILHCEAREQKLNKY